MDTQYTATLPPGIVRNDSAYAVKGRFINSNFIRSWEGKAQKWQGWGSLTLSAPYTNGPTDLLEPARGGTSYVAFDGNIVTYFGTANHLWLIRQNVLYDITPQALPIGNVDAQTTNSGWGSPGWGGGPWGGNWTAIPGQGAFPTVWTIHRWGQDMVCAPRGNQIYVYSYSQSPNLGLSETGNTHGTTTIDGLSAPASIKVGDQVFGTNIPSRTYVVSVNVAGSSMVISQPAGDTAAGKTLTFITPAVPLSSLTSDINLPNHVLGIFVTDDRELVAFGAAVGSVTYDPLNVAWCTRQDFTTWTPSLTNTAGAIRAETGNQIMGAIRVYGGWLVLTDLSAHAFTFIGGNDIYAFDRIGSAGGCISPQAMCEINGVGYWVGAQNFQMYNGRVNDVACDVHELFYNNVNRLQNYKIFMSTNRAYGEVIVFAPVVGNENDSAVSLNVNDNSWHIHGALAGIGAPYSVDPLSRSTWIDLNPLFAHPIGVGGGTHKVYTHDLGTTGDGSPINYVLETGELELRSENGDLQTGDQFYRMKKLVPDWAYVSGQHQVTVEARGYPQDAAVNKGPYQLAGFKMINPKARYKSARLLFQGTGDFRLGDIEVYSCPDGRRLG